MNACTFLHVAGCSLSNVCQENPPSAIKDERVDKSGGLVTTANHVNMPGSSLCQHSMDGGQVPVISMDW